MSNLCTSPETGQHWQEAGIDWVTFIAAGKDDAQHLERVAYGIKDDHVDVTAKRSEFRLKSYKGEQWPGVKIGRSGAKCLVQLSGATADASWIRLASCGGRVSRLDVQTTVSLSTSQPAYGMRFLRRAATTPSLPPRSQPKVGKSRDNRGLFLGTVGHRTDPRYGRVYDKGVEQRSALPGHIWRVEIEAKGTLSPRLWTDLLKAQDVRRWCLDTCAGQWRSSGLCWPLGKRSTSSGHIEAPRPDPGDDESKRAWLKSSVAPVVSRLLNKYSAQEVAGMLGLTLLPPHVDDLPPNRR